MRRTLLILATAAMALGTTRAEAQTPSIWTDVMQKKKLTVCIVPSYQPYSWKDAEGKWQGFVAEMARNVSGALRVEPEFVETTFQTVVLTFRAPSVMRSSGSTPLRSERSPSTSPDRSTRLASPS